MNTTLTPPHRSRKANGEKRRRKEKFVGEKTEKNGEKNKLFFCSIKETNRIRDKQKRRKLNERGRGRESESVDKIF